MDGQHDDLLDDLGGLLRAYRRGAGLTQTTLARAAGLSDRGIQAIENGERRPYPRTLARLVAALRLTPAQETQLAAAVDRARSEPGRPRPASGLAVAPGERKPITVLCVRLVVPPAPRTRPIPPEPPAVVAEILTHVRREVERHGGAAEEIDGDGRLVALFGIPAARQDHAAAALRTALAVRATIEAERARSQQARDLGLGVSIGVETGRVESYQVDRRWRIAQDAGASPLEMADRLARQARTGAIWAGAATRRAAGEAFGWRDLPPLPSVNGRASELSEARSSHALPSSGPRPIVGRHAEIEQLRAAWTEARAGHGRVVAVLGEAGIGKSRLIQELTGLLDAEGAPWAVGACFGHAEATAYLPFREIVWACLGARRDETPTPASVTGAALAQRLAAFGLETEIVPYLLLLLGGGTDDPLLRRLPPDVLRARTVDAVVRLLLAAADLEARAILVEDAHWIDSGSEAILAVLAAALADHPLLLVLTGRQEELHPWAGPAEPIQASGPGPSISIAATLRALLRQPQAANITLARLAPDETNRLVHQAARRALPAGLVRLAAERSEGNPLFAVVLAQALTDAALAPGRRRPTEPSAATVEHVTEPLPELSPEQVSELPGTIRDVLLARVDRLPAALKRILQMAAVIGPEVGLPILADVAEPGPALESALVRLEDLGFLTLVGLAPERRYAFGHALMQAAVYEALLPETARRWHDRVGQAIERRYADRLAEQYERLAHQYAHGNDDAKAVEYLILAGRKAAAMSAVAGAAAYAEAALVRLERLPDTETERIRRIGLLVEQFPVMLLLGRLPEYHARLRSLKMLVTALDRPDVLAAYLGVVGACEWAVGQIGQARATLLRAIDLMGAGDGENRAMVGVMLGRCELDLGHYEAALRVFEDARPAVERSLNLYWHRLSRIGTLWAHAYRGRWDDARAVAAEAQQAGEVTGERGTLAEIALNLALVSVDAGELTRAATEAARAMTLAQTPADRLMAEGVLGIVECHLGMVEQGTARIERALPALSAGGLVPAVVVGGVALGVAYARAGRTEIAGAVLTEYARRAGEAGMRFQQARAARVLGELLLATAPDQAAAHLDLSVRLLTDLGADHELGLARAAFGRLTARR